jgi:DNA-binding protein H-NS
MKTDMEIVDKMNELQIQIDNLQINQEESAKQAIDIRLAQMNILQWVLD